MYLIHALQTQFLEGELATFWGAFSGDRLVGVFLVSDSGRRRRGYLAGDDPRILAQLGERALRAGVHTLLGKREYIQPAVAAVENLYPRLEVQKTQGTLSESHPGQLAGRYDYPVQMAMRNDIPLLVALDRDFEFASSNRSEREIERDIERVIEKSACFLIQAEGRAVSAARIDPETDRAGVIESSRTLPEFRRRGMYSCVRTACVEYLCKKGKVALGVAADTNVGVRKVVESLGGTLTEPWLFVRFRKGPPVTEQGLSFRARRWAVGAKDRILRR